METVDNVVLEVIWSHLPGDDLLTAAGVCRRFRRSIIDFWERYGIDIDMSVWPKREGADDYDGNYRRMYGALISMLPSMPKLRRLCVKQYWCSYAMPRVPMHLVTEHCRDLEAIDLNPFEVSVDSLKMLAQSCPHLKEVTMPSYDEDKCLPALLKAIPKLTSLTTSKTELTDEEIRLLPTSLRYLACVNVPLELQARLNTDLSTLLELRTFYWGDWLVDLHNCRSLKSVLRLTNDLIGALPVDIEHVYHFLTDDDIVRGKYPKLKTIVVSDFCLEDVDVTAQKLAKLSCLRCVKVSDCEGFVYSARVLYGLVNLREVHILRVAFESCNAPAKVRDYSSPEAEASTDGWPIVADIISQLPALRTLAVIDCWDVDYLSELRFLWLGESIQRAHKLTLYSNFRGLSRPMDLPEWGYNLHPNGRLCVRNKEDWRLNFRKIDDEWEY